MYDLKSIDGDFKMILDSLPTDILVANKKGIVTYANKAFELDFGKKTIESMSKGPGELLSCTNSFLTKEGCGYSENCINCMLRKYINTALEYENMGESKELQLTVVGDFGEERRWLEVKAIPVNLQKEKHLIISFSDVTLYKKSSLKLLKNKKLAEAMNKSKSEFLANMSHEIRTPLNGLLGMLELTMLTSLDEEQRENLEVAQNCADTLLGLINDILDISKIESNKVVLEEIQFDLRDMMQRVVDVQAAKVLEKDLQIKCIVEEQIPPYIIGDSVRLQQVLNNLTSNAVKFTEKGQIILEVKTLCKAKDVITMAFSVEDSGIGISQKEMQYLFKPFSQVDGSISRKYGGTGLGLAISQSLVQLMGGEIKVKSVKDKGSVFYFTIQVQSGHELQKENSNLLYEENHRKHKKILIVEDNKANQMVIQQILKKMGYYDADVAANGYEAIKCTQEKIYDAILMDIQLPELNGIETTQIIREKEKNTGQHIPIIALTARALKEDREQCLESGMDDYISKPIDTKKLSSTLKEIFNENKEEQVEKELQEVYAAWKWSDKKEGEEDKTISPTDRRTFKSLLNDIGICLDEKEVTMHHFIKIEKMSHELKVRSMRKGYEQVKAIAFRMELEARKKDKNKLIKLKNELEKLIQS